MSDQYQGRHNPYDNVQAQTGYVQGSAPYNQQHPQQQHQQQPAQPNYYQQQQQQQQYQQGNQWDQQGNSANGPVVVSPNSSFAGAPIRTGNGTAVGNGVPSALQGVHGGQGIGSGPVSPMSGPSSAVRPVPQGTTRVCRHFIQGKCTWGDGCRFLHDASKISESNPPLSPPGQHPLIQMGMPPPIQVGGNGVYGIPPALAGPNSEMGLGSGPVSPNNASFSTQDLQPNVVVRSRSASLVAVKSPLSSSRPLSPGAAQRYAHNPYGDHSTPTAGHLNLDQY